MLEIPRGLTKSQMLKVAPAHDCKLFQLSDGMWVIPFYYKSISHAPSVREQNPIGARGEVPPDDTKSPVITEHGH